MAIQSKHKVGRNDPCPCGSGLKYKRCHGDPGKIAICEQAVRETMLRLIRLEQRKQIVKLQQKECEHCNGLGIVEGDGQGYACPDCQYINEEERIAEEYKRLSEGEKDETEKS